MRSAFRIEYDRDKGSEPDNSKLGVHARSAAHVQIHGHSEEIGYIQGLNGNNKLRNLSDFHFPVGGRRFRPSLEDFIEFIHSEKLVTTLNSGWQNVLAENRGHWLEIQLKSAVRAQPDVAIKQLTEMGYQVTNGA